LREKLLSISIKKKKLLTRAKETPKNEIRLEEKKKKSLNNFQKI